jgi:hypothetical protein
MIKRYKQLYFRVSIIFSILVTIIILFAWYKKNGPNFELIAWIYLFSSIVAPLFILLLGWMGETYYKRQTELIFNRPPLLNIQPDKFELLELKSKSKWFPSSFVLNGIIDGYNVFFNLKNDDFIKVQVTFPFYPVDKETLNKISISLNQFEFKVYSDNICKTYGKSKLLKMTHIELLKELQFVTSELNVQNVKTAELGWC